MSIIKEKIKFSGDDINIQIPINNDQEFTGYQQEIEEYTNIKVANSINDATDGEVTKFKLKYYDYNYEKKYINFTFFSNEYNYWRSEYIFAGFTKEEVERNDLNFLNSFFILDFFNSVSPIEQTKIFSTYLTNLDLFVEQSGQSPKSIYSFDKDFQLYDLNIPIAYLNISNDTNIYTGYSRISFYNGKTGRISIFYNYDNENITTPEKMFFKTELDFNNKTWDVLTPSFQNNTTPTIFAKEFIESNQYIERFNKTFEDFVNLQQNYPNGSTFDYKTGKYQT